MSDVSTAHCVAARYLRGLIATGDLPPGIAAELENLATDLRSYKPRRRQRGVKKRKSQRAYRRTRQKSKRTSQRWRDRNPSKAKRYERKRRRNPQRHRLRRAKTKIPFWDLEHGLEGEVTSINPEEETLQAIVNGEPKEYGVFPFLDDVAFESEEGEDTFFDVMDEAYDVEPDAETRQARELSMVWMVHDPRPEDLRKPSERDPGSLVFQMTLEKFIAWVTKVGVRRWGLSNSTLHDDLASALKDSKERFYRWKHRFDISKER